jgi:transcriptional regulator with XRE-family HTH domain
MKLSTWLKIQMEQRGINSLHEVGRLSGVSRSTIVSIMQDIPTTSLDTLEKLAAWAGVDVATLIEITTPRSQNEREKEAKEIAQRFMLVCKQYPDLEDTLKKFLDAYEKGFISPADIDSIAKYAEFITAERKTERQKRFEQLKLMAKMNAAYNKLTEEEAIALAEKAREEVYRLRQEKVLAGDD